ncbi:hypothetical protein NBRC111894_3960 [Sporolactobacillus inulinus]|uniref:Uncharacterized protein n=1 Tax=Sporolactobacillus inulinus TaxID=2078 RepID=A0A4Y1ZGT9_9BACL|nr:hypothetical protein [Sporolactobacillus inulinus]GAY78406.1 hypothetical protein NBRC111894_3960 [Sporolactobacillus inulinus]
MPNAEGKTIRISLEQVCETLGAWNRSFDELQGTVRAVFDFSRPFLKRSLGKSSSKDGLVLNQSRRSA